MNILKRYRLKKQQKELVRRCDIGTVADRTQWR